MRVLPATEGHALPGINEGSSIQLSLFASPERESFRDNALLAGIGGETYTVIERGIEVVHYGGGETVFNEHEPGDCLYLIAKGSVKISKKGRGGQQETLAHLSEQDFFGEMALVDSGRRSAQASAVGYTVLGRIDRAGWDLLLHLAPHEVLGNFTRSVTKRLRNNNQHFIEQMMRNERLSLLGTTISSVAHDMNNPINCIMNACEVIHSNFSGELAEEMTSIIRNSVKSMETMTREFVDFSHGKTRLHWKSFPVKDLLNDLQPHFVKCRPLIDVHVDARYDGQLHLDRHRLARVFSNLIRNAREAMDIGKKNQIRFSIERIEATVRFVLSDTGHGIPKELLPQIFEPFVTHGKKDGTGLGLAISKAVVEAHHGTISVSSDENGTSFQIDLPVNGNATT